MLKGVAVRAVIRKTSRQITIQFVKFNVKGDAVICSASSKQLSEFGFTGKSNTPSAYLTGLLAGLKAKALCKNAIADLGRQTSTKGGVLYAAIAGINEAGVSIPVDTVMVPSAERLAGKHSKATTAFDAAKQKILAAPNTNPKGEKPK
jgi:large subunit ribosomal protein L18